MGSNRGRPAQNGSLILVLPIENVVVVFSAGAAAVGAGFLEKIGVSGVGGSPVQLASEDAELTDDVDSKDCFRCR